MLSLLRKQAKLFKQCLYKEVNWWHENLLKYLRMGHEDQKAGSLVLQEFYIQIADVSKHKSGAEHKQIVCVSRLRNKIAEIGNYTCIDCFY